MGECGAWGGCRLPAGHNIGRADVPENHSPAPRQLPEPCAWCHHAMTTRPPFDCKNPMHSAPRQDDEQAAGGVTLTEAERTQGTLLGLMNDGDRRLWFTKEAVERILTAHRDAAEAQVATLTERLDAAMLRNIEYRRERDAAEAERAALVERAVVALIRTGKHTSETARAALAASPERDQA